MAAICTDTFPVELWTEILLRAPTKSVIRLSCVSTQWRNIVTDSSFRKLHHDKHATPSKDDDVTDALLVSSNKIDKQRVTSVFPATLASPATSPMCRINNMDDYNLTNICNGFLCFASCSTDKVIISNPITGEKLAIPKPPPLKPNQDGHHSPVTFALGFSPTTGTYKLFRFADRTMDVYTLLAGGGETNGWRQHPLCPLVKNTPPVTIGGKICMVTAGLAPHRHRSDFGMPGPVLVVDVTSEEYCTYSPPDYGEPWAEAVVCAFGLHGKLCLGIRTDTIIQFWTMPVEEEDDDLPWELLYKFKVDMDDIRSVSWHGGVQRQVSINAWLDGETHTLCCKVGNSLYCRCIGTTTTTTTTLGMSRRLSPTQFMSWDHKIHLPVTPLSLSECHWDIYMGYRPSLLSPLTFKARQHGDDDEGDESGPFIRSLLRALQHQKSLKCHPSPTLDGRTNTKRICTRSPCKF
uniref:F-box domain-containing protein n=1 Tax=Leersia perrieri TaxID=77586 RepID=A0A0D9WJX2_9ORYZ